MKYPFDSLRFWIALFLFAVYLLTFSGKFHVMDELAVFAAGHNLAQHGRADINQLIWTQHWTPNPPGIWGEDNNLYTKKAPGISFITAPLIWLGHKLPGLNAVHVGLLTNILVTALTASFLFLWLVDLGFARISATITSLAYGLCTIAWIYARMFWESSLLALTFLIAVWAIFRATRLAYARQRLLWIFVAGCAMAVSLTLRFESIPAILLLAFYLSWESISWQLTEQAWLNMSDDLDDDLLATHQPRSITQTLETIWWAIPWGRLILYFIPVVVMGGILLGFNWMRYGNISETGYTQELLFQAPWIGSFGLLLSPGRGLFIYAPFTLLLFLGILPAKRRLSAPYFWLVSLLCLFYWLFYGSWFAWGGTWGWGPRFLLPIIPLLMLFVAEPIEWTFSRTISPTFALRATSIRLAWLGLALLAGVSIIINLLGLAVDFNEHFLRLGRNDNFVFNWETFPPLAHWQILQEGVYDIIWLQATENGLRIEWFVLIPAAILFAMAAIGLGLALKNEIEILKPHELEHPILTHHQRRQTAQTTYFLQHTLLYVLLFVLLPVTLTYEVMRGTAEVALEQDQSQADLALLETLSREAQPGDSLLTPMPPWGDVWEVSTLMMGYLDPQIPTAVWIESEPRAIKPEERDKITQATMAQAKRVWLFERWLTADATLNHTTAKLNQFAFPIYEDWFEQSGKLTLYAVGDTIGAPQKHTLDVPFEGGVTLLDFTLMDPMVTSQDNLIRLQLTWHIPNIERIAANNSHSSGPLNVFVQLIDQDRNIAQQDRLLLNLQLPDQSPLLPGETRTQGYALRLPEERQAGSYPLIVGLYHTTTQERLSRIDDSPDDFLYLTDVVVK